MKTIQFISESIDKMQKLQIPANIQIGTFEVKSTGSLINWAGRSGEYNESEITFKLVFRPDHIQTLIGMGVKIDLDKCAMSNLSATAKRFKAGREAIRQGRYAPYYYQGDPANQQTGVIENWLETKVKCSIDGLKNLDKFCRDNHRNEIAIHNDTILAVNGWFFKAKYPKESPIESQYFNAKKIRINAQGKKCNQLQPIEKRVLKLI